MTGPIGRVNYLLRTFVLASFVGLAFLGYTRATDMLDEHSAQVAERDARIERQEVQLEQRAAAIEGLEQAVSLRDDQIEALVIDVALRDEQIDELETALRFLKIDHRLARLTVLDQGVQSNGGGVQTTVRFEELDDGGETLGEPIEYTIPGKVAYVESLVIKFDDDYVEAGDVWRGTSICLFRRLFSENQSPNEGFPLDKVGLGPLPYTSDNEPDPVSKLWMRFWDYANDPSAAAGAGVRAMHGETPFMELQRDASYLVELRSSGGLSLRRE